VNIDGYVKSGNSFTAILGEIKQKIASSLTLLAMTVRNIRGSLRAKRSNLNALVSHRELLILLFIYFISNDF